ncbi:MAG TPA: hypothetical protein VGZ48_07375 [Candidatus Acidoferrales bacterium]|jgi:hypothetical protein|nr:hypothetical protein [Candidatus Acidoferrales bacterium]
MKNYEVLLKKVIYGTTTVLAINEEQAQFRALKSANIDWSEPSCTEAVVVREVPKE